jgi:hypothetical protein
MGAMALPECSRIQDRIIGPDAIRAERGSVGDRRPYADHVAWQLPVTQSCGSRKNPEGFPGIALVECEMHSCHP